MGVVALNIMEGLTLPPDYTVSEWADANVFLTSEIAAEPGPFRTSRTPYAREMMDAQIDPSVEIVVYHTSAQIAKTTVELVGIGYHIHHDPCPMLMVLPTDVVADSFSKGKLAPFIEGTTVLKERVEQGRNSRSTILRKEFAGGYLVVVGANTPQGLAMNSVRVVWADEIDRFPVSAGKEGDPLTLAFKRAQTFANRKLVVSSTPTTKGTSRIDAMFEMSDKRYYYVPLPCCGVFSKLIWENIKWRPGEPETAEYACSEGCGCLLSDQQIKLAVNDPRAEWRAEAPFNGVAGFHIWQIYSPWSSLREIVKGYEATKHRVDLHQPWWNTTIGESWDSDEAAGITAEQLLAGRRKFPGDMIPKGACVVCASVDVQKDWLEVLFVAFGPKKSMWLLSHQKIFGDPSGDAVWDRLKEVLSRRFRQESHPQISRPVEGVAIDSGFNTQRVYDFCAKAHISGRPWFAIKGVAGPGKIAWDFSKQKIGRGIRLHLVGVDGLKGELYARLASNDPSENNIYIRDAEEFGDEFLAQLISERSRKVIDKKGYTKTEWFLPPGARNEALDLVVYSEAVHRHLNLHHEGRLDAMQLNRKSSMADLAKKIGGGEAA